LYRKKLIRPSIDEETVDVVHVAFHHSPRLQITKTLRGWKKERDRPFNT